MIRTERRIKTESGFNFRLFSPRERIVFLDIETTGLKAGSSQLYLIGLCAFCSGEWILTQLFAESPADEICLIEHCRAYLKEKRKGQDHLILVTYNGDTFDIPFLRTVEKQYGKEGLFRDTVSFDLYRAVRPYKKLLGLENLQLKTVEKFCGIEREDPFSGGELIYVYEEFLRLSSGGSCAEERREIKEQERRKECLDCLLLHNAEDLEDMLPVMNMLAYRYLFEGCFSLRERRMEGDLCSGKAVLDLKFTLETPLPKELYMEDRNAVVSVSGEDPLLFELCVPVERSEKKLFFENFREYYYLPAQDMAVHRSVGEFVDRKNRVAATRKTCYCREEGLFYPVPAGMREHGNLFRNEPCGSACAKYTEEIFEDSSYAKEYARAVLIALSSS